MPNQPTEDQVQAEQKRLRDKVVQAGLLTPAEAEESVIVQAGEFGKGSFKKMTHSPECPCCGNKEIIPYEVGVNPDLPADKIRAIWEVLYAGAKLPKLPADLERIQRNMRAQILAKGIVKTAAEAEEALHVIDAEPGNKAGLFQVGLSDNLSDNQRKRILRLLPLTPNKPVVN